MALQFIFVIVNHILKFLIKTKTKDSVELTDLWGKNCSVLADNIL